MTATTAAGRLDPAARDVSLAALAAGVDVLVVGGGVTGAGVALDAALRGLRVGLVEQRDFTAGTSSRSSKLIHGGLRYLEQFDFKLVREALHERKLLLEQLAPHLVRPLPFLYPLRHHVWERPYVGAGLTLYDSLAGIDPSVPRHSHMSKRAAMRAFPSLKEEEIAGAVRYHDAQVDDARFALEVIRTAVAHGAHAVSGARVVSVARDGERVTGVTIEDSLTGSRTDVPARVVVNATGPWSGRFEQLAGVTDPIRVRTSKGVHLVIPGDRIEASVALITKTPNSVLFVLPWGSAWLLGTTDTAWTHDLAHPVATAQDVEYLLDQANSILSSRLTESDVTGVYAGLRPLVDQEGLSESELSREHVVRRALPGLVTIAGGKYTTYRVMAADTIDACAADLGDLPPCTTAETPLLGAAAPEDVVSALREHQGAALLQEGQLARLAGRYGRLTEELLDAVAADASMAEEVPGGAGHLRAEVLHAATHEGALHVDDVLTRRTRLYLEAGDRGLVAARHVAAILAPVLGWDEQRVADEVRRYRRRVAAELEAQSCPDDDTAAAVRDRVRDPRVPTDS